MLAFNKKFKDTLVNLDGGTFEGCAFERCTLLFSGLMPPALKSNTFSECKWEFAGPAANTIAFMAALYTGGGEELVEKTLEEIRKGGAGRRRGDPIILN
ncbi:hypothetical protein KEU06_05885 [Pseudaminobacter sp. 19-2017]|uniref:Uncharacterized protein n=1 Tax=Pseudaminobacter soli (ex Zhang et al. 2022) TaxID=2831468 RepID=A0A942I8F2_9HYPH|nr:hypothetical protein [Pseudaminobacter soli]MBS3648156.1 hypothetical protein [Pseudaminobacter soli]